MNGAIRYENTSTREGSEGNELHPHLKFHVDWNRPNHQPIDRLTTDTRFEHMQGVEIDTGLRVPLDVTTTVSMSGLDEDPGQPVHTGENIVEFTDLQPVNIREEFERRDFQDLLHHDRVYPDKPGSWPLENPFSIIPDNLKQEFEK